MKKLKLILAVIFLATQVHAITPVRKPLQFVLFAFDGSEIGSRWADTLQFAKANNVKYTYFVSGVMFLGRVHPAGSTAATDGPMAYEGPGHNPGQSDIGFSSMANGNTNNHQPIISERIAYMNQAIREGHELGSHANGHFDGSAWTAAEWDQEFADLNALLFAPIYKGTKGQSSIDRSSYIDPTKFLYNVKSLVGFRTPYLSQNANLFPVLQKYGYRYDTSKTSEPNYWPEKKSYGTDPTKGVWNFPLAELRLANAQPWEQAHTLSMDYNFYVSQQRTAAQRVEPVKDPENTEFFYQQMLDTYRAYFKSNYDGNRAPVHIGHHFALWNDGAYWRAMKQLAVDVCHLQDVRCITYTELADFMDTLTPAELQAYKAGSFTAEPPALTMNVTDKKKGRAVAQTQAFDEIEYLRSQLITLRGVKAEKIRRYLDRWSRFEMKLDDKVKMITRQELAWLDKIEKPLVLKTRGFNKTYQELLQEGLGCRPSKAHACEGGGCDDQ